MTTEQAEQTQLRPFHETIVEVLRRAKSNRESHWGENAFSYLCELLTKTEILEGHEEVLRAWEEYLHNPDLPNGSQPVDIAVKATESLLAQKQAAEAKAKASNEKLKDINLDELEREADGLLIELKGLLPQLAGWNVHMQEKVQRLYDLVSSASKGSKS